MFTRDFLPRMKAKKLAIVAVTALLLALTLFAVSERPAHACLTAVSYGDDSFARAASPYTPPLADHIACDGKYYTQGTLQYGNSSGATMEVGEPQPNSSTKDCGYLGISNSVWWKVKVPARYDGSSGAYLRLSTKGSSFDTVLAVYQGSSLTSLRQVACSNDNSLPNWNDVLIERLRSGQTYYLQLSGTGGARSGSYNLYSAWRTGEQVAGF
jgi:hypothetical protein